jgi:molybdopterin converting factor small subunit
MKAIKTSIILACLAASPLKGQYTMPEILDSGTLREQWDYMNDRTRIYNDFRAIREDMFQKIRTNSLYSLRAVKKDLFQLEGRFNEANVRIESLQAELQETNDRLDEAIKNRDRLSFFGTPMNKTLYNSIVWIVIAGLAFLSVILFLTNKRLLTVAHRNKRDLEETREDFEAHRKQSREKFEQLVVQHHNELKKLKGT